MRREVASQIVGGRLGILDSPFTGSEERFHGIGQRIEPRHWFEMIRCMIHSTRNRRFADFLLASTPFIFRLDMRRRFE